MFHVFDAIEIGNTRNNDSEQEISIFFKFLRFIHNYIALDLYTTNTADYDMLVYCVVQIEIIYNTAETYIHSLIK